MALSVLSRTFSGFDSGHLDCLGEDSSTNFKFVSEDIIVNIFSRLEGDPRHLARLACVCQRFLSVVRDVCWKRHCVRYVPDLLPSPRVHFDAMAPPPGGWDGLMKLLVCCPGLKHSGVLLDCWDFGLDRELGSSAEYNPHRKIRRKSKRRATRCQGQASGEVNCPADRVPSCRSDLHGSVNSAQQKVELPEALAEDSRKAVAEERCQSEKGCGSNCQSPSEYIRPVTIKEADDGTVSTIKQKYTSDEGCALVLDIGPANSRKRKELSEVIKEENAAIREQPAFIGEGDSECKPLEMHLASGVRNLSREQGTKLLASRFRADCLYICDWPGCEHPGEKRKYYIFRGIFKNFRASHVWRNLKDMKSKPIDVPCAFCSTSYSWDMMTAFCLRRSFEYHDDGEPVVRAYVCENGHVSGAWTDRPVQVL
ncbi:protein MpEID1 [Marchantia polymorpha subsp. ruderalis]|uniref:F-box domain-containing protein n=2 Tax=Marchantia polymorpha TaxID=3197 RepID=A0AAF6BNI9_MARPO|nr:hypothetical protein MARPO_0034s0045 [Marchantia polymorpha]BBN13573.1 hypothetical protein Mp_6g04730 [Marchantia polymorpha subsp. ruderalis]|eukprot:PTQ41458.1 hypothetical protein MARPO_0034s0045 [Marchantia polymorpha]